MKCTCCSTEYDTIELRKCKYICKKCGKYMRIPAYERIELFTDKNSFVEYFGEIESLNILDAEGYTEKIKKAQEETGLKEAVVVGTASVFGEKICIGVCDSRFLMGSMGKVVGEKITLLIELAIQEKLPVFMFCCSGGARMQEGIISLMQMEKTAAALAKHSEQGLFYCTILTDPTTGGVTASFAMLGDVIMAEPGALIGFAGQRVIKQTIGQELPEGFQTAEFQEQHGMIDGIVERKRLKKMMQFMILANQNPKGYVNFREDLRKNFGAWAKKIYKNFRTQKKTAWEKVRYVRGTDHPSTLEYIEKIFDIFVELKGDRTYANDMAIIGGIGFLNGQPITVITEDRGKNLQECVERNFGMPNPEGYRKALRLMKQAEKFNRPIISFINTAGAYCGMEAEERGQGEAIARNLFEMSKLKVPTLAIIVGEAGSGGALATAIGNEVWMFENATYSILTPEGYASILWKDANRAEEAAEKMHIVAEDLKKLGIIEKIIPEYGGATYDNLDDISNCIKQEIISFLYKYNEKPGNVIAQERYERFRRM